ncbi:hypothetical protein KSC_012810 [Ktedonobacter sp. SOSP1-52]|nr:hypothetical protein KSC_012810 [Ktedonobacter sp. SOSP1-52]
MWKVRRRPGGREETKLLCMDCSFSDDIIGYSKSTSLYLSYWHSSCAFSSAIAEMGHTRDRC